MRSHRSASLRALVSGRVGISLPAGDEGPGGKSAKSRFLKEVAP
jgi:hypothetical protein